MFTHSTKPATPFIDTSDYTKVTEVARIPWQLIVWRDEVEISRVEGTQDVQALPEVERGPTSLYYEVADGNHRLCNQLKKGLPYAEVLLTTYKLNA